MLDDNGSIQSPGWSRRAEGMQRSPLETMGLIDFGYGEAIR
jgi:hypothetical protein